jgi:hypothetical protein
MSGYELWGSIRLREGEDSIRCYLTGEDGDKVELLVEGVGSVSNAVLAAEATLEEQEGQSYGCDEWRAA